MAFPEARVVVLCCLFVHFGFNADFFLFQASNNSILAFVSFVQGVTLLFFPLLGLLADTCCTRFNFIKVSSLLLLVSSLLLLAFTLIWLVIDATITYLNSWYMRIIQAGFIIAVLLPVGMFEAVAIQFGMDQMVEASSDQLSTFIHWYYWSMNIGVGILALVGFSVGFLGATQIHRKNRAVWEDFLFMSIIVPMALLQTIFALASFLTLHCFKRHLTIEPAGHNPFTTVYKVLRYAWKHKCPENRSAFTYWEENIPPRIDLGKNKYGGPFTTEEVEDVKTFFLLFLLLLSLLGFHLADNGYSVMRELNYKLCPSAVVHCIVFLSPNILNTMTVLVCVPLLHYIVLPHLNCYVPNMLHRLGIGSALIFFQELAGIVIILSSWEDYNICPSVKTSTIDPIFDCFLSNFLFLIHDNITARMNYCGEGNNLFLWLLIPIFTRTLAYHLVFMTALEFISAQAPLKMKGSLITLWYAISAQRYIIQGVAAVTIGEDKTWLIFHGGKAFLILLSVLLYCCVAKRYRYRLRDEVVNEHYLVEEVYDRELRMAEEYEREENDERSVLVCSTESTASSDYGSTATETED